MNELAQNSSKLFRSFFRNNDFSFGGWRSKRIRRSSAKRNVAWRACSSKRIFGRKRKNRKHKIFGLGVDMKWEENEEWETGDEETDEDTDEENED